MSNVNIPLRNFNVPGFPSRILTCRAPDWARKVYKKAWKVSVTVWNASIPDRNPRVPGRNFDVPGQDFLAITTKSPKFLEEFSRCGRAG